MATATAAMIGISSTAMAVLLMISESSTTPTTTSTSIGSRGSCASACRCPAITVLRPEAWNAVDNAMPPPNSTSTPQGRRSASFHSSRRLPFPSPSSSIAKAPTSATVVSLAFGSPTTPLHPPKGMSRNTQAKAVSANTPSTRRSAPDHAGKAGRVARGVLPRCRPNQSAISGISSTTTGTPMAIHSRKPKRWPVVSWYTPMKTRLGGVPIGVPRPPMLAA